MTDWNEYARKRKDLRYYRAVREEIMRHSPGDSILDVGCGGTDLVETGDFADRLAINLQPIESYPSPMIVGRWPFVVLPRAKYDVVLCCQVLEHLDDYEIPNFCNRLHQVARTLIVTVPHLWPAGRCKHHKQDPVDIDKLTRWLGVPGCWQIIVDGTAERLLAVWSNDWQEN